MFLYEIILEGFSVSSLSLNWLHCVSLENVA